MSAFKHKVTAQQKNWIIEKWIKATADSTSSATQDPAVYSQRQMPGYGKGDWQANTTDTMDASLQ